MPIHSELISVIWLSLELGFACTGIVIVLPLFDMQLIDCILLIIKYITKKKFICINKLCPDLYLTIEDDERDSERGVSR